MIQFLATGNLCTRSMYSCWSFVPCGSSSWTRCYTSTKLPDYLGKAQRQWLADFLAGSDDRPTVLFVHHTLGDGDGDLLDINRLYRLVRPHRKVKAIFYGHSHEYAIDRSARFS